MNQTMREQLSMKLDKISMDWTRNKKEHHSKPQKRRAEVLTDSDIKSLMGINKPTYRRYRGSFRQR